MSYADALATRVAKHSVDEEGDARVLRNKVVSELDGMEKDIRALHTKMAKWSNDDWHDHSAAESEADLRDIIEKYFGGVDSPPGV